MTSCRLIGACQDLHALGAKENAILVLLYSLHNTKDLVIPPPSRQSQAGSHRTGLQVIKNFGKASLGQHNKTGYSKESLGDKTGLDLHEDCFIGNGMPSQELKTRDYGQDWAVMTGNAIGCKK